MNDYLFTPAAAAAAATSMISHKNHESERRDGAEPS